MPVEKYASLVAILQVFPDKREAVLERFGVGDDAGLERLRKSFARAFEREPPKREAFDLHLAAVRARLGR